MVFKLFPPYDENFNLLKGDLSTYAGSVLFANNELAISNISLATDIFSVLQKITDYLELT